MLKAPHLYVDADACPVKPEVFRVAARHGLSVTLVAGAWMRIPADARIHLEVVAQGFDAADDWIAERAEAGDIVVTADVALASRCLARGAAVIGSNGRTFTEDNIGDAMATRELLADLRGAGEITRGPLPFTPRDRSRFLQSLESAIRASMQRRG
ncbi:MAG: YaiI/YqxD family protein [Candidatus Eisenbacteria bacterium]